MATADQTKANLTKPKGANKGRTSSVRGRLVGHDGEWFRLDPGRGQKNYRVAQIGPDQLAKDTSYLVAAEDFEEIASVVPHPTIPPDLSVVSSKGTVVIPVRLRDKLGIREGTTVIQEELDGGVWIRPVDWVPRPSSARTTPTAADRDDLISRITLENVHDEFDTGGPVGREVL